MAWKRKQSTPPVGTAVDVTDLDFDGLVAVVAADFAAPRIGVHPGIPAQAEAFRRRRAFETRLHELAGSDPVLARRLERTPSLPCPPDDPALSALRWLVSRHKIAKTLGVDDGSGNEERAQKAIQAIQARRNP